LGARLVATVLLLGGTLALLPEDSFAGRALLSLIATAFGTTVAFSIALQRGAATNLVASAQVAVDLGLVTGLVYLTGGAHSGFGSLYAAVVLVSALLLGPRPTVVVSAAALLLYLGIGAALSGPWPGGAPASDEALPVALIRTAVGLVVVGGLAAVLAERLSRAQGEAARAAQFSDDVVRSIAAGLVTVDVHGKILTANAQAHEVLRAREGDLSGRSISTVLPVDHLTARARIDGSATRLDGTTFPVGLTRTPLLDARQEVHGSLLLFQDVSELVMLRAKAEHAERLAALGRLAAGLAHEIRNPLGSISGSVELVRDTGSLDDEDRRLLDLVLEEAARLDDLVGTMLSLGRPSAPERAELDVAGLVRQVVEVARSKAHVAIELVADEDARVYADGSQLRQVLWNLLKNATQFSPRGALVEVRVKRLDAGVAVEIEDHGEGIGAADLEHIFDMFFTKRPNGVGVGLALVKQILDAHGARIDVRSELGRGTTFRIELDRRSTPVPP
jgi:two-component system sensor histidine kinase PilS (NtrC family)